MLSLPLVPRAIVSFRLNRERPVSESDFDLFDQALPLDCLSGRAVKTKLTTKMSDIRHQISASRSLGKSLVRRAKIILMAFEKESNQTIAGRLEVCPKTVGLWRRRWRDSFAALLRMQFTESQAAFGRAICECLRDAPRSGVDQKRIGGNSAQWHFSQRISLCRLMPYSPADCPLDRSFVGTQVDDCDFSALFASLR